jgi:hypothetical protein
MKNIIATLLRTVLIVVIASASAACMAQPTASSTYDFTHGYPTPETAQKVFDDLDLNRALSCYRAFFPTVSGAAIFKGQAAVGVVPNRRFGYMDTKPRHVGFTLNSDTPYGGVMLDLHAGPMVVELPPGPILGAGLDFSQRWIMDMGLPGPDAGKGGKHLLLPPGYEGDVPDGHFVGRSTSYKVVVGLRSLPDKGDVAGAIERLKSVKVYPLKRTADWTDPVWFDMTPMPQDTTPVKWEDNLQFWKELHEFVQVEPTLSDSRAAYGELASIGIEKGKPFAPDQRMKAILEDAAKLGSAQMRVESLSDRRSDRVVWPDRQWQWASLRFENGSFDTPNYTDTHAREKWFYQAIAASPAMFKRDPTAGSLYWLGLRDSDGDYLDGGKTYRLIVPMPVPDRLFWSVTVYDAQTRSQVQTDQGIAALRSLFELKDIGDAKSIDLYFGPTAPRGYEARWIKTIPERGWFVYFRIYGPQSPAFDGSWKPGDFAEMK